LNVLSKSFSQTWPHLKLKQKSTWNRSCKYYFISHLSRVSYSFQKAGRPFEHVIVTFDPNKFAEKKQQRLHLGNLKNFTARLSLLTGEQSSLVVAPKLFYETPIKSNVWKLTPYPPNTKGFLYYSMSPEKPRIAGELRFRVTSSDDPASFESGSDLLRPDGLPWSRPLYILSKYYPPLYEKLREEQFIPDDLDRVLAALPKRKIHYSRSQVLYTLNDTFIVNFGIASQHFLVITEQSVESLRFGAKFFDGREMYRGTPYTGADPNNLSIVLYSLFS
jgi:hypothetical protein